MSEIQLTYRQILAFALILFIGLVIYGWTGFLASDDAIYANGAYGWINEFPFVGGHGTIRYTITVPVALSFLAFGENEFSLALPTLLYCLGLIAVLIAITQQELGTSMALVLAALLATNPILVTWASIASVDIIEAFFIFLSVVLFYRAVTRGATAVRLFFAGVFAALAFLTRETTVFYLAFLALLFLFGYGFGRWRYFIMAGGFLAVWLAEVLYLFVMTGDPLYRLNISLHHGDGQIDRSIDVAGNFIVHPMLDPIMVVLANQEFVFLFWFAIPFGIWMALKRDVSPDIRRGIVIFGGLGLFLFLCNGAAHNLLPLNPRYFLISALCASVVTAIGLVVLSTSVSRKVVVGILCVLIGGNLLGIYVENRNFLFGEKALADIIERYPGRIYTDPATRYRADLLLIWRQADDRVEGVAPPPGSIYVYNAARKVRADHLTPDSVIDSHQPKSDWRILEQIRPSTKLAGKLIRLAGVEEQVPRKLMNVLSEGHPGVIVYEVPD